MKDIWINRKKLKVIRNDILLLAGGAVAGLLLLLLVYCIPVSPMKVHIRQSLPMLEKEFSDSELLEGYPGSLTGSFTDCLMLENAIYTSDEHTTLEQILRMYRGESGTGDGWAPGNSLADYAWDARQPREVEYARYWHGYLVVLKPLLFLTTVNGIRVFASTLQLIFVSAVVMACGRRGEVFLGWAFLFSVPFLYFFSLFTSLSLSICYYVMTALLLIQLRWDSQLRERGWYGEFFLVAGMITSYFDFLTYPLVTLGFPLCVCLYLDRSGAKNVFRRLVGYSVQWGVGYLGFWAIKWVLADILTGSNTIQDGISTIFTRTDIAADCTRTEGFLRVIRLNGSAYSNWAFLLLFLGIAVWFLLYIFKRSTGIRKERAAEGAVLLLVVLFPFVWFFFTQNHSEQHWIYTFKIFSVSIFALLCGAGKICGCALGDEKEVRVES